MSTTRTALAALSLAALTACYGSVVTETTTADRLDELSRLTTEGAVSEIAGDEDLPVDLLLAIAWKASAFSPLDGEHDERAPVHGWLGLTDDQLVRAADLTGLEPELIEENRDASLVAGAAVLAELRDELVPFAGGWDLNEQWWPVLTSFSALDEPWSADEYAADVFAILQNGLSARTSDGDLVTIEPREIPGLATITMEPPPTDEARSGGGSTDYPGAARFVPAHSGNWSSRSGGVGAIDKVVIHTTEGSYDGAISWFRNPASEVSAHYVIRKSDGQVTQMVRDKDRAWHARGGNADSVGIEHEGSAWNAATWTNAMLDSSARLSAWLSEEYDIPIDRTHFIGHREVPGSAGHRYDPGDHFPWDDYITLVKCFRYGNDAGECSDAVADGNVHDGFDWTDVVDGVLDGIDEDCGTCDGSGTLSGGGPCGTCDGAGVPEGECGAADGSCGGCEDVPDVDCDGAIDGDGTPDDEPDKPVDVDWITPRAGDEVGNPTTLVTGRAGPAAATEYWMGPYKLGPATEANPANLEVMFHAPLGSKTVTAKALGATGAVLDSETITFDVVNTSEVLTVHGNPAGGMTWRMTATVEASSIVDVKYRVDGYPLTDDATGSQSGTGDDWGLTYTFDEEGDHRLLVAKGYDASGVLVAEDATFIDVSETALPECPILQELQCGSRVTGTTAAADASDVHDGYPNIPGNWSGPEVGYSWFSGGNSTVEIGFVAESSTQLDLDIIVLQGAEQQCRAEDAVDVVFNSYEIEVEPGTWYTFVVDGYDGAEGAFELEVTCGG